ncbi:transmembrane protein 223 [Rhynchophorus ferrugineus]|uniref:transmembrane protein 223 n=1 Tax=Rhynchophorus ferrugineus TaxID=354439 RepID=UPI003FCE010E
MSYLARFCTKLRITSNNCNNSSIYKPFLNRPLSQKSIDVNTNVVRDVLLFKTENDKLFKALNIFAIFQFGFWSYLSLVGYKTLKDIPVDSLQETVWWRKINLGENKYRVTFSAVSFVLGFGFLSVTWLYTLRSIKYLILRKTGKQATIVTYGPLGKHRMFTLDLENISAMESRASKKSFIPLKVRNHSFYYMVDMRGEFKNPLLYDNTVGLKRIWCK